MHIHIYINLRQTIFCMLKNIPVFLLLDLCFEDNVLYLGHNISYYENIETADACQILCQDNNKCNNWTFGAWWSIFAGQCWLRKHKDQQILYSGVMSGPKYCGKCKMKTKTIIIQSLKT